MIKNDSVKKLESLKTIANIFLAIVLFGLLIYGIIALTKAPADSLGLSIFLFIVEMVAICIVWVIVNLIFDHAICRRQENIDYMNARLEHLNGKKIVKSEKKEVK